MKKIVIALLYIFSAFSALAQSAVELESPSKNLQLKVTTTPTLTWQLSLKGKALTLPSPILMDIQGKGVLGENAMAIKTDRKAINEVDRPVVRQKNAEVANKCNELTIKFKGDWSVTFRAYDNGVAYRISTQFKTESVVSSETFRLITAGLQDSVFYPEETSFFSHNERRYPKMAVAALGDKLASLPALFALDNGVKIVLTEADLQDYPGLWLRGMGLGTSGVQGVFSPYPKKEWLKNDRDLVITESENFIAKTKGTRDFPWRVMMVSENDGDLIGNQLPYLLSEPSRLKDAKWIKPGKVAWDWWNFNNIYGQDVNFDAGINTATYKYYVDFAAANKLEYIVLDEGWTLTTSDILHVTPDLDMEELLAYAKQKNVGVILWVLSVPMEKDREAALDLFQKWGVKGIKMDFMQRDDQKIVNFCWKITEECAKRQLLTDLHGTFKPCGLHRTYPNLLTSEGVYGLENCKWDSTTKSIGPEHNVTIPFTRMSAGPMDYTPGAMLNYGLKEEWTSSWNRPASMGTRCHELAKYVVYESPLQMLADNPTHYKKEPESLGFISKVPSVWDKTVVLPSKVGDFVAVARQAGDGSWYVGAMTDWTERPMAINTTFLPTGNYELEIFEDGRNANRNAQDYTRNVKAFKSGDVLTIKLASGGGMVAVFRKK
jgi:alpha-glucosidase